ncbi:MAG: UDP-N-acetylmuramate dehydrogenase [Bacteroidetes bacterium]|nr:MAG: UDP-N-acetylmuramate dehydrogenase [Bacteroidota bacterium]
MKILENVSLKKFNTFGINANARYFLEANTVFDIQNFLADKSFSPFRAVAGRLLILGGGSNILFTKNFDGVVLKNNIKGIELLREDAEHYYVKAGAGELWHQFVLHCIKNNYAGVENLSLIPGSIGAAPIQNIGAYGVEQKEVFLELEAINIKENKLVVFSKSDCRFDYRDSIFKQEAKGKFIITSVTFKLYKTPKLNTSYGAINREIEKMGDKEVSIASISRAVCNIRRSKLPDPEKIGNAGSFFKNPTIPSEQYQELMKRFPEVVAFPPSPSDNRAGAKVGSEARGEGWKLAAGWLIEQCGWKGKQVGNTGVHKDQALVLVNYGNAKGAEVFELSEKILQSVKEKFDVELEREVVVV